jgi:hypothetical protein
MSDFNSNALLQILTINFYSIGYYNSEICLLTSLKVNNKKAVMAASAT